MDAAKDRTEEVSMTHPTEYPAGAHLHLHIVATAAEPGQWSDGDLVPCVVRVRDDVLVVIESTIAAVDVVEAFPAGDDAA